MVPFLLAAHGLTSVSNASPCPIRFTSVVTLISAFALPAFAKSVFVIQNHNYSNPNTSLSTVTCSSLAQDYANFSSIPAYPNIGGIPGVIANPALCGSCWSLTPAPPCSGLNTLYFTVIDDDSNDVVDAVQSVDANTTIYAISMQAYGNLTHASCKAGAVYAEAAQVDASMCGM